MLSGLIAVAAFLALSAVPADRLLASVVRRRVSLAVQAANAAAAAPAVSFAGRAFLPQLLAGRFREVRVTIGACAPGGFDLAGVTARLTDVRAPLLRLAVPAAARPGQACPGQARPGQARPGPVAILAGGLNATAVIGLAVLSARLPSGLRLRPHGKDLRITGTYLLVPVRGTLAVTASGDQITVTPKLTGVTAPVGFVITLPGLPRQVAITAVSVTPAGLEIALAGEAVELRDPSTSGEPQPLSARLTSRGGPRQRRRTGAAQAGHRRGACPRALR